MRAKNVIYRNAIRAAVLFGALGGISLAGNAAKIPDFKIIGASQSGSKVTFGPTGQAASFDARLPMNPVNATASGWTSAGNYGATRTATGPGMTMAGSGDVFFAGVKYPFQAGYAIPAADMVSAAASLMGGWVGVGAFAIAAGYPYAKAWLEGSGGRINQTTGALEQADRTICYTAPCYEYLSTGRSTVPSQWMPSLEAAARRSVDANNTDTGSSFTYKFRNTIPASDSFVQENYLRSDGSFWSTSTLGPLQKRSVPPGVPTWVPASMNDILPYMGLYNPDPRVMQEILAGNQPINLPNPTITGPATLTGADVTTTNPDGTKTIQKTTYNFQTSGNTVTNTSNTTATTNYNADNSVKSVSSTTTTPSPTDQKDDECKQYPNRVGCSELDTPEGEIPKTTKTVTYSEQNVFGAGSCPADLSTTVGLLKKSVKVWDWQKTCDLALPLRALVLALATFGALLIVMPGGGAKS